MSEKQRCCVGVYDRSMRFPQSFQCKRNASVEFEGKHYCKQHDPVRVKQAKEESSARWKKEWEEAAKKRQLERAAPDLLEALEAIEHALKMGFPAAEILDENSPIRDGIRTSIAKAKGEA